MASQSTFSTRIIAFVWRFTWQLAIVLLVVFLAVLVYLDAQVRQRFEGHRWTIPAKVYARPLELYIGKQLAPNQIKYELDQLGYRQVKRVNQPGQYNLSSSRAVIYTRGFHHTDATEPAVQVSIALRNNRVVGLQSPAAKPLNLVRLESQLIGGLYPAHNEDRELVQLADLPNGFLQTLLAIEDRSYYEHLGVSFTSLVRATIANIKAGRVVQGGSTLTQQLVKNFYLNADQTIIRKAREAIMAILLTSHYSKDEILEVYLNEVFLGQQGKRSIHGFGLGSWHFFGQPINELDVHQIALLVGMIKGPSIYNPERNPKAAKERRDLVLKVLGEQGLLSENHVKHYQAKPLELSKVARVSRYPAYLDLVRRQLRNAYKPSDLTEQGLRIFTTISPWAQFQARQAMVGGITAIGKRFGTLPKLQGAAILSQRDNGEILAVVGDKDGGYAGHNWALDGSRQIGSLIKPIIHLAALESGRYHLGTPVSDEPISISTHTGSVWQPKNFDKEHHGVVPMFMALAKSYNVANVRLGMDIGVNTVLNKLSSLGVDKSWQPYPSRLLGAVELSPYEVNQVYQSIANNGFSSPLSIVRNVTGPMGNLLSHYPYRVRQAADTTATYILQRELEVVGRQGTGRGAYQYLNSKQQVAGKTGTTNDQRDSWFSGFSGRHVATIWLGNNDNTPTPLTGASGALLVWAQLMAKLPYQLDQPLVPQGIKFHRISPATGLRVNDLCEGVSLPFNNLLPESSIQCSP